MLSQVKFHMIIDFSIYKELHNWQNDCLFILQLSNMKYKTLYK